MSRFSPISIYDVPQVAAAQLAQNPLRATNLDFWQRTLMDPDALSPQERTDLADMVRKGTGLGADRVSKTLLETATNPFVWLGLLTSPVGSGALRSGKSIFNVAKKHGWYQKEMGWFGKWFKTVLDNTAGSPIPAIAMQKATTFKKHSAVAAELITPARKRMVDKLNAILEASGHKPALRSLDLEDHVFLKGSQPVAWDLLRRFKRTQEVHILKLDSARMESIKKGAGKRLRLSLRDEPGGEFRQVYMDEVPDLRANNVGANRAYHHARLRDEEARLKAAWEEYRTTASGGDKVSKQQFYERERLVDDATERTGGFEFREDKKVDWEEPLLPEEGLRIYQKQRAAFGQEFEDLLVAETRAKQYGYVKHFGDETLFETDPDWVAGGTMKTFRPDRDKLAMFAQSVSRYEAGLGLEDYDRVALEGLDLFREAIGPDNAATIMGRLQKSTPEDYENALDFIGEVVTPAEWGDTRWFSRNTMRIQKVGEVRDGVVMTGGDLKRPAVPPPNVEGEGPLGFSGGVSRSAYPLTDKDLLINTDVLDDIFELFGRSTAGGAYREKLVRRATEAYHTTGNPQVMLTLTADVQQGTDRYLRSVLGSAAEVTTPVGEDVIRADWDYWTHVDREVMRPGIVKDASGTIKQTRAAVQVPTAFGRGIDINVPLNQLTPERQRRTSLAMALDREYLKTSGPTPEAAGIKRKYLMEFVRPAMGDRASEDFRDAYRSMQLQKRIAGWFVNSWAGKTIRGMGEPGQHIYEGLKAVAEYPDVLRVSGVDKKLAKYFYVTHLGANISSVVLNLMQPLTVAATMGNPGDILGAYKDALADMWKYAGLRGARGMRFPSVEEKLEDMQGAFGFMGRDTGGANLLDIGPDFNQILDSRMTGRRGFLDRAQQVFMSAFEKSEWFNRDVTAHLVKRAYMREGLDHLTHPNFARDVHQAVLQFQFGQHDLNTPGLFLKGPLRSPLARQFATFPIRSFVTMTSVAPTIGGIDSAESGLKVGTGAVNFWLRTMATSALVHEVSRNMLNADLDRGLAVNTATELFGGNRALDNDEFQLAMLTPPVVDVVYGLAKGIATSDEVEVADAVARLVPGGVAFTRSWGVAPQLPAPGALLGLPGKLQKTYAGWDQMAEGGLVPVYNAQGALIDYKHWTALMARGLGFDLGAWGEQGKLDHYLMRQRDEILKYRHEYLRRLRANDVQGAMSLVREFGSRFKDPNGKPLPLTVSKDQVTRYFRQQITSRSERILDRMPPGTRGLYAGMVEKGGHAANLPREALTGGGTARARDKWRPGAEAVNKEVDRLLFNQGRVGGGAEAPGSL